MYKNWTAIYAEEDLLLRGILVEATDPRTLAGLRKGFPEFFSDEPCEVPERLPAAVLRGTVREIKQREGETDPDTIAWDAEFDWHRAIEHLRPDIPLTVLKPPSRALREQLVGQIAGGGMVVKYRRSDYLVVHVWFLRERVGETIEEVPELDEMIIAPLALFDLE